MTNEVSKLRAWLNSHGAGLEFAVGRTLRESGWTTRHGGYFVDVETSKTRDLDVHASIYEGHPDHGVVSVVLAVECKRSRDKPWVAFTSSEHQVASTYEYALAPGHQSQVALLYAIKEGLPTPDVMKRPIRIAHGLTTAHTNAGGSAPTDAYAAVRGAISAAAALTSRREEFQKNLASTYGIIDLVLPVVVLDGHLFEMYIDDAGAEVIMACNVVRLVMPDPMIQNGTVVCTITTLDGLQVTAASLAADARTMASRILPSAKSICDRNHRGPAA
jgi:hypothetical protein